MTYGRRDCREVAASEVPWEARPGPGTIIYHLRHQYHGDVEPAAAQAFRCKMERPCAAADLFENIRGKEGEADALA